MIIIDNSMLVSKCVGVCVCGQNFHIIFLLPMDEMFQNKNIYGKKNNDNLSLSNSILVMFEMCVCVFFHILFGLFFVEI